MSSVIQATITGRKYPVVYSAASMTNSSTLQWNAAGLTGGRLGLWTEKAILDHGLVGGSILSSWNDLKFPGKIPDLEQSGLWPASLVKNIAGNTRRIFG